MAMIRKLDGKYVVLSETTGRKFGTYDTRAEAERRQHLRARLPRRRAVSLRGRA